MDFLRVVKDGVGFRVRASTWSGSDMSWRIPYAELFSFFCGCAFWLARGASGVDIFYQNGTTYILFHCLFIRFNLGRSMNLKKIVLCSTRQKGYGVNKFS